MADILIRGMEMPKTCVQCDLKIYDPEMRWDENGIEQIGAWVCKRTREIIWNTQRGENCPLVPLPEGHGRLGDLDKINASLEAMIEIEHNHNAAPYSWAHAYTEMQSILDDAPTIVPAEGGTDDVRCL